MAKMMRKLATLATAAEAARRYAKNNPDQAAKYLDQAAAFVDKQTKGRYTAKIDGVAQKVKGVAGVSSAPGSRPGANGYAPGGTSTYGATGTTGYSAPQPSSTTTPPPTTPATTAMPKPTPPAGGPTTDR